MSRISSTKARSCLQMQPNGFILPLVDGNSDGEVVLNWQHSSATKFRIIRRADYWVDSNDLTTGNHEDFINNRWRWISHKNKCAIQPIPNVGFTCTDSQVDDNIQYSYRVYAISDDGVYSSPDTTQLVDP